MKEFIKEIKEEYNKSKEYRDNLYKQYPNCDKEQIKWAIITHIAEEYAITPYQVNKMIEQ